MPAYKSFMYKRFCRLFPLYIVMTLVYFFAFHQVTLASLLVDLTLFQGFVGFLTSSIPPGWSLTNEWIIYFIFPIVFSIVISKKLYKWLVPLAVVFLLIVCTVRGLYFNWANYKALKDIHGFNPVISETRGPISFLRTIADYLLGIFAYLVYSKGIKTQRLGIMVVPALLLLLLWSSGDFLIIMLMPFLILYATNDNWLNAFLSSKPVHFLGLISYSLYVNHYIFINTYKSVSDLVGIDNKLFSISYVLISTFVLSCITFYAIERPGLNFLRKKSAKKEPIMAKI